VATDLPKVERLNARGTRYYRIEGSTAMHPSVTTILNVINKPALVGWAARTTADQIRERLYNYIGETLDADLIDDEVTTGKLGPTKIRDAAGDFGTRAHNAIEEILLGSTDPIDDDIAEAVAGFRLWWDASDLDISVAELMVVSEQYGYGGSTDVLAYRKSDGKPAIVDWKTSSGIYTENALQAAAYAKAWEEMTGEQIEDVWVVRLKKKIVGFDAHRVGDVDFAFDTFLHALDLWKRLREEDRIWDHPL
jgi:hypothetical protein